MKYTKVNIEFLSQDMPESVKAKLIHCGLLLQIMMNSTMLRDFILNGNYSNNENEMFLSNGQIYDYIKEHDLDFKINYREEGVSGNRSMSQNGEVTNVRSWILNDTDSEVASKMAHEIFHYLGFNHKPEYGSTYDSFLNFIQFEGERLFRKYKDRIPGFEMKILTEQKRGFPLCWMPKKLVWR